MGKAREGRVVVESVRAPKDELILEVEDEGRCIDELNFEPEQVPNAD